MTERASSRKDIQVYLHLHNPANTNGVQGMCQVLRFLAGHGAIPAIRSGRRDIAPLQASEIETRVTQLSAPASNWSHKRDFGKRLYDLVGLPLLIRDFEELIASVTFSFFAPDYLILGIGGLADFEFVDQSSFVEPFAQRIRGLALCLWDEFPAAYGYLSEGEVDPSDSHKIEKLQLPAMHWVNLFGPAYVTKYGKSLLTNIPGYLNAEISHGGVMHQLTKDFFPEDRAQIFDMCINVRSYFANNGLQVGCYVP